MDAATTRFESQPSTRPRTRGARRTLPRAALVSVAVHLVLGVALAFVPVSEARPEPVRAEPAEVLIELRVRPPAAGRESIVAMYTPDRMSASEMRTAIPEFEPLDVVPSVSTEDIESLAASELAFEAPLALEAPLEERGSRVSVDAMLRRVPRRISEPPAHDLATRTTIAPPNEPTAVAVARVAARPDATRNEPPRYPPGALRNKLEGRVILALDVSAEGIVIGAAVQVSSGHADLDAAALEAARSWRFVPATENGLAVAARVELPITFRLTDARARA